MGQPCGGFTFCYLFAAKSMENKSSKNQTDAILSQVGGTISFSPVVFIISPLKDGSINVSVCL